MAMPRDPGDPIQYPSYAVPPPMPSQARKRITGGAHTVHLVLTVCTCGAWGVVWFLHWLFTRSKTTYR
ncbi:hypothetical protein [Actinomadura sp. SCN-SB]|uniref:hypothetical protein n=1 Tax=Actinomadura sp. SCN-SB TaxID=3373092 RepID=UPI00375057A7